jgi:hypothetical protein
MLKNTVERDRPHMTVWRRRIARWITKATNTNSEYVILIAFPLQQWLHERASLLRYTLFFRVEVRLFASYCSVKWAHRASPGEMLMNKEHWQNDTDGRNQSCRRGTCPSATLSTTDLM